MPARPYPLVLGFGIAVHRAYIDSRLSKSSQKILASATHICPASIRTLNGPLLGSVHVGVRFKAQVHHHGDGPGLLGSCYLKGGLLDQVKSRSLPNKAVDVMADKLSGDRWILASSTYGSLEPVPRLSCLFRLRSLLYDPPRGGVAQRLINLATHPKPMQQDRQLPRYRYRRSLLRVFPPALAQPQSVTS
jgi:hypothetical protein